jgi:hypothetical protein
VSGGAAPTDLAYRPPAARAALLVAVLVGFLLGAFVVGVATTATSGAPEPGLVLGPGVAPR